MVQVEYDRKFLKEVKKLPLPQRKLLAQKLDLLAHDPFDLRLHTKSLNTPLQGIFSFRVNREYRALFRFVASDRIFIFSVKHRKDIYR